MDCSISEIQVLQRVFRIALEKSLVDIDLILDRRSSLRGIAGWAQHMAPAATSIDNLDMRMSGWTFRRSGMFTQECQLETLVQISAMVSTIMITLVRLRSRSPTADSVLSHQPFSIDQNQHENQHERKKDSVRDLRDQNQLEHRQMGNEHEAGSKENQHCVEAIEYARLAEAAIDSGFKS